MDHLNKLEGELRIGLCWNGHRVDRVSVRSLRPFHASRIMEGKPAHQAVTQIPLMFSVCGKAQGVAAALAFEAARNIEPNAIVQTEREGRVLAEAVQEHLWRILLDWPQALGQNGRPEPLALLRKQIAQAVPGSSRPSGAHAWQELGVFLDRFLAEHVFGTAATEWLELESIGRFENWLHSSITPTAVLFGELWNGAGRWGRSDIGLLPELDRAALLKQIAPELKNNPDFARYPSWSDAPAETGALARMRDHALIQAMLQREGNTVAVRMAARLVEIAALALRLKQLAVSRPASSWIHAVHVASGVGMARVETARGMLLHFLQLDADKVARYVIVAPTEWNFHPAGACVEGLLGLESSDPLELRKKAELLVASLDPCVAWQVEVERI